MLQRAAIYSSRGGFVVSGSFKNNTEEFKAMALPRYRCSARGRKRSGPYPRLLGLRPVPWGHVLLAAARGLSTLHVGHRQERPVSENPDRKAERDGDQRLSGHRPQGSPNWAQPGRLSGSQRRGAAASSGRLRVHHGLPVPRGPSAPHDTGRRHDRQASDPFRGRRAQ